METQLIPSTKTHLDGLNAMERFESYHHAASPLCHAEPLRDRTAEDARCSGWLVGEILFCTAAFSWTRFRRSASQARNDSGFLLELCRGEERGEADGHPLVVDGQGIVLRDLSRPYDTVGCAEEMIGIMIPRHRIDQRRWLSRHAPTVTFPLATPRGQILQNTIRSIMGLLPGLTESDSAEVAGGFVGLLNGLLANEKEARGECVTGKRAADYPEVDAASLDAMKAFLLENLHQSDLSATALTRAFHCSRAKVYRLFADEGGVSAFIRKERLDACHDELSHAERKRGMVQQVAERWGFLDPYHFSRLFKRTFGEAPSSVLGTGSCWSARYKESTAKEQVTPLRDWVQGAIDSQAA